MLAPAHGAARCSAAAVFVWPFDSTPTAKTPFSSSSTSPTFSTLWTVVAYQLLSSFLPLPLPCFSRSAAYPPCSLILSFSLPPSLCPFCLRFRLRLRIAAAGLSRVTIARHVANHRKKTRRKRSQSHEAPSPSLCSLSPSPRPHLVPQLLSPIHLEAVSPPLCTPARRHKHKENHQVTHPSLSHTSSRFPFSSAPHLTRSRCLPFYEPYRALTSSRSIPPLSSSVVSCLTRQLRNGIFVRA